MGSTGSPGPRSGLRHFRHTPVGGATGEHAVRKGERAHVAARRDAGGAPTGGEEAVDAGSVRPQHPLAGIDVEASQCDARRREQQAVEMARHRRVRSGPSGRNSSADLPMGSGCPLRAQRLYSSTVDSSTDAGTQGRRDAGTPILSARRRSDGAILRLTNRLTDPKSRVKTMWLALPSSSWPSGRLWSGGEACTTAPRLGASRSGWAAPFRTSGTRAGNSA